MLYLIATPIGNLKDVTLRALEILKKVDYILAEDTRHSKKLLDAYDIKTRLVSFHEFSDKKKEDSVIEDLLEGKTLALISDAGTPLISDPGYHLIQRCTQEKIEITTLPGACAPISALILSGFNPSPFQFIGFLPRKEKELSIYLKKLLLYEGTIVAFESPKRLLDTLRAIGDIDSTRQVAVARELTKQFEEVQRGNSFQLITHFSANEPRGEFVLVIQGKIAQATAYSDKEIREKVALEIRQGMSHQEASKKVAEELQLQKRYVYNVSLNNEIEY